MEHTHLYHACTASSSSCTIRQWYVLHLISCKTISHCISQQHNINYNKEEEDMSIHKVHRDQCSHPALYPSASALRQQTEYEHPVIHQAAVLANEVTTDKENK